jgi:hypothetical protein
MKCNNQTYKKTKFNIWLHVFLVLENFNIKDTKVTEERQLASIHIIPATEKKNNLSNNFTNFWFFVFIWSHDIILTEKMLSVACWWKVILEHVWIEDYFVSK